MVSAPRCDGCGAAVTSQARVDFYADVMCVDWVLCSRCADSTAEYQARATQPRDDIAAGNARESEFFARWTDRGLDPYEPATS